MYKLNNAIASNNFVNELENEINKRAYNPEAYEKYISTRKRQNTYYTIYVKNYTTFYTVKDNTMEVSINMPQILLNRINSMGIVFLMISLLITFYYIKSNVGKKTIQEEIITNNKMRNIIDARIVFIFISTIFIIIVTSINVARYHTIFFIFTLLAIFLNIFIVYHSQGTILTKEGKEEQLKLIELKNYINDYSLIKNRDLESVIIWDKYLAYATAFGIPSKITDSIYEGWYNLNINLQVVETILS